MKRGGPHTDFGSTPAQRQVVNQLYSGFLRALIASWRCVSGLVPAAARAVDVVQERVIANKYQGQEFAFNQDVINGYYEVEAAIALFSTQVRTCVHKVEVQRLNALHSAQRQTGPIPLYLHIATCKNFVAQVREWSHSLITSLPPPFSGAA